MRDEEQSRTFGNGEAVGNQQKWDTFVKERSGGDGRVLGLPQQAVVAFAASEGLGFHLPSLDRDFFSSSFEDVIRGHVA
jgi:hypothetical protein